MKLYNFERLVKKYSVPFKLVVYGEGEYVDGKFVKGEPSELAATGAIVPMSTRKIYQSGGTLDTTDRELYMLTPIPTPLKHTQAVYKGRTYSIEEEKDYTDYSDVSVYILRWVEDK